MYAAGQKRDGLAAVRCLLSRWNRIPTCGATIMRSTWTKAVLLLASCGALAACGLPDGKVASISPQGASAVTTAQVQAIGDTDPGKYDVLPIAQPADRVVEF
jgi:hypothetical protein